MVIGDNRQIAEKLLVTREAINKHSNIGGYNE
jgi:hypothetical protein